MTSIIIGGHIQPIKLAEAILYSDRSKAKKYELCRNALDSVAVELSCLPDDRKSKMSDLLDTRIGTMNEMTKSYKKCSFMAEAEIKKDCKMSSPNPHVCDLLQASQCQVDQRAWCSKVPI